MASLESPATTVTPPHPDPVAATGSQSPISSASSSASESDHERPRRTRLDRPRLACRPPSASIIIPKDKVTQQMTANYPPDDARAMSPRRGSADLERLSQETREALKSQAKTLQSSLQALADKIDEVKTDHDRLESENKFLQDYIGGLTRTMSRGDIQSTSGVKGKK